MKKTNRKYGAIVSAIRSVATLGHPFTRKDVPATMDIRHRRIFALLVKKGELKRIEQGSGARRLSIYQIANS